MKSRFVYHKNFEEREFKHTYYVTKKSTWKVGDKLYVISGDRPKKTEFFLLGRYIITGSEPLSEGKVKLNLAAELRSAEPTPFAGHSWFDRDEFRKLFVSGQSLNEVREEYVRRFDEMLATASGPALFQDAINDETPERPLGHETTVFRFDRNQAVREQVLRRANGSCELCGAPGFLRENGTPYLECHHIIALASDGEDRLTNVIALCANHHREAHHGARASELEAEMAAKVAALNQQKKL